MRRLLSVVHCRLAIHCDGFFDFNCRNLHCFPGHHIHCGLQQLVGQAVDRLAPQIAQYAYHNTRISVIEDDRAVAPCAGVIVPDTALHDIGPHAKGIIKPGYQSQLLLCIR